MFGNQYRQRFRGPMLAFAQPLHRDFRTRITHQVIAANALDRDNLTGSQPLDTRRQRRFITSNRFQTHWPKFQRGATEGTGQRLGVMATVGRIVILRLAIRAQ